MPYQAIHSNSLYFNFGESLVDGSLLFRVLLALLELGLNRDYRGGCSD